jgi:hypothetical protein
MSQDRVDNLFASESWSAVYTAFTNVSLKAYDFDTIREALLLYIKQTYPDKYNDFIASSEFVAVLDLVAYLGHSLSYRLDMNTRENFMDLAERKESILRIAKTMGYNKTRPINSRGFMKISSVMTSEPVFDSNGVSLANRVINWNDANNTEWYENFITVINASLNQETKIKNPKATKQISTIEHNLYEINENTASKTVVYGFKANVAGKSRTFEAVRAGFGDEGVMEMMPDRTKNFTIINRNDNLGPASDRTGFFVFTKLGKLTSTNYNYTISVSNRVQTVPTNNISNSDVWIQKLDNTGAIVREVTKVDNETRETAIFNALRTGSGDIVNVRTTVDNGIELHYPDGNFGNAAYGNYRAWYRVADNESYSIDRDTVENASITIPYIGSDGVSHQLTITLTTTRDFSENFAAETMASVRRIAPRSYYAQDRMVNAQDYNVLPLSLGQNVVKKVKAINTNFSGNSRYFEMDDVTGHHSNVTVNSTDGSMYLDDDRVTVKLRFNKENGNAINFIRNEISKVIKNGSLANRYYIDNIINKNVVINTDTNPDTFTPININIDPTDPKAIEIVTDATGEGGADPHPAEVMYPGDFVKIETENESIYWTRIYGSLGSGGGISNNRYTITDILPEEQKAGDVFRIVEIVKGFRTRFEDFEIIEIKNNIFEGDNDTLKYYYDPNSDRWTWTTIHHNDANEDDITVKLNYNPGVRMAEAEYTANFTGKKVVFESEDDVKFFYSNNEKIVDIETNLAHQDRIKIDYYQPGEGDIIGGSEKDDYITLGYSDIYNLSQDGINASFDIQYKTWSGAPRNLEFIQDELNGMRQPEDAMNFVLVNSSNEDVPEEISGLNQAVPKTGYSTPIGNRENDEYTLPITLDISDIVIEDVTDPVTNEGIPSDSIEFEVSSILQIVSEDGNVANANSTLVSLSSINLDVDGFKGKESANYFDSARDSKNFVFIKGSELPANETVTTIDIDDPNNLPSGVVDDFVVFRTDESSETYQFQFSNSTMPSGTNPVYWKQFAYAELEFVSERELSINTIVVKLDGLRVNNEHLELVSLDNLTYKLIFWTVDPEGAVIDIYDIYTNDGTLDFSKFKVRAQSMVKIITQTQFTIPEYSTISSYIYDNYTDSAGNVDYRKVKLTTMDSRRNPYGMIDVIGNNRYVIIQKLPDSTTYELSSYAFVTDNPNSIDEEYYVYYNTEQNKWFSNEGVEVATTIETDGSVRLTNTQGRILEGTRLKLVKGITYMNNSLARYNWEHFADADRRIDPSTSNIVDVYVLTADYTRRVDEWKANGFQGSIPKAPNNFELKKIMENIKGKEAISDHVSYVPVKFKTLFGEQATQENQAVFKVVKKAGTLYTDSEIKSSVSAAVNEYFKLENWDFGDTFYFSELAAYIHTKLPEYVSSVVITPKYSGNQFTKLLSITSEPNEIFMSVTTSADVKIIETITDLELLGE